MKKYLQSNPKAKKLTKRIKMPQSIPFYVDNDEQLYRKTKIKGSYSFNVKKLINELEKYYWNP